MTTQAMREPFGPERGVREVRDEYLAENGFSEEAYDAKWTEASFLGLKFRVPNTKKHADLIRLHDLHHVATGYGTDLAGEGEISAWELQRGARGLGAYVGSIVTAGALLGLLLASRRTRAAWRAAPGQASLFQSERSYEELLGMTVGELRDELGLAERGIARDPRGLHAYAPRVLETG